MENSNIVIETEQLSKKFDDKWAVSNIDLTVREGQIFGFLGPNGAGKSTFIRMLTSLLKPSKGQYKLFGQKPGIFNKQIYSRVGTLIEEPCFYNYLTGEQNLTHLSYLSGNQSKSRINKIFERIDLNEAKSINVSEYSHGMKKRLALAQALVHEPELLILDEPTSGLDPDGVQKVEELLLELNNKKNITIFLSSHNLQRLQSICDHMALIHFGKLIEKGPVSELLGQTEFLTTEVVVDQPQAALELLLNKKWANKVSIDQDNKIKLHISQGLRPKLVKLLVKNGFKVYSLQARSSLKDHYFSIVNQQSNQTK